MRKTPEEISALYSAAVSQVQVGGYYAHYKHPGEKRYQVITVGLMEDTWMPLVTYKHLATGTMTVRTLENFTEKLDVDGVSVDRFTLVD